MATHGFIHRLKEALRRRRTSTNPVVRQTVAGLFAARHLVLSVTDPANRALLFVRWFRPESLHQTTPLTWPDRYPEIFSLCRDHFGAESEIRILSFGCSTGEEVLTLRRYFSKAFITGAEINPRSLATCRALPVDARIRFTTPDAASLARYAPFDLVTCMAVLQRTPHRVERLGIRDISRLYPFARFDRQLVELDSLIRPGGLLVLQHAQYRFEDSSIASRYDALPGSRAADGGRRRAASAPPRNGASARPPR